MPLEHLTQRRDEAAAAAAGPPAIDARVLATCSLPCLLLLDFGGVSLRTVATLSLLIGYLMHSLEWPRLSFSILWTTVIIQAIGLTIGAFQNFGVFAMPFSHAARALDLASLACAEVVLVGAWGSLQFDPLHRDYPELAALFERLLRNVLPLPSAAMIAWGVATVWRDEFASSAEPTPMALLAGLCVGYHLLGCRGDAAVAQAPCMLLLPSLLYVCLHAPTLLPDGVAHAHAMACLASAALVLLCLFEAESITQWVPRPLQAARPILAGVALLVLSCAAHHTIDGRLRLSWYGKLVLALAIGSVAMLLLLLQTLPESGVVQYLAPALVVATLCSATVLFGLHSAYHAAAFVAALSAVSAWRTRGPLPCGLCVLSATAVVRGVLQMTIGFIEHTFVSSAMPLSTICIMVIAMVAFCGVAISCTYLRFHAAIREACLLAHAALLTLVEAALLNEDDEGEAAIYPTPLLVATILGSLVLCGRLFDTPANATLLWLLLAVHGGRAALLTGDASLALCADCALVVAANTQVWHIGLLERQPRRGMAKPTVIIGHSATTLALRLVLLAFAALRARASLLPSATATATGSSPPPATILGAAIALYALGAYTIATTLLPPSRALPMRMCAWLLSSGALIATLQPILDIQRLAQSVVWTLLHPTASLTFGGTPRLLLWPPWLLLLVALAWLAESLRLVPKSTSTASSRARLLGCALLGTASCLSAYGVLLPLERSLFLAAAVVSALAAVIIGALVSPTTIGLSIRSPLSLLLLLYLLCPLGLVLQAHTLRLSAAARAYGALASYRAAWLGLYAGFSAVGALIARVHAHAVLHGTLAEWASGLAIRAQAFEHRRAIRSACISWVGGVGNACTCAAYTLVVYIIASVLDGTARAALPLSSLLLLLHPHTPPCRALNETNRYAPVASAAAANLIGAAALNVWVRVGRGLGYLKTLRIISFVGCATPSLLLCCHFLWTGRQGWTLPAQCSLPLTLVPMLIAHARPLSDLGAAGCLAGCCHLYLARRVRLAGLKTV